MTHSHFAIDRRGALGLVGAGVDPQGHPDPCLAIAVYRDDRIGTASGTGQSSFAIPSRHAPRPVT